ncbi:MAG: TfoX/Sxy family protein [Clostridia bacterium]|nr:TfoX/Sxy family protein [Clostridia bacterium]
MASTREYLEFVLEQLSAVEGITYRPMMGEYIIYCGGKVIGGVYDDRFLVKPTKSAKLMLPDAPLETPYEGAKEMFLPDIDNKELLARLIPAIAADLPAK